jgi:hypothetical protein
MSSQYKCAAKIFVNPALSPGEHEQCGVLQVNSLISEHGNFQQLFHQKRQ